MKKINAYAVRSFVNALIFKASSKPTNIFCKSMNVDVTTYGNDVCFLTISTNEEVSGLSEDTLDKLYAYLGTTNSKICLQTGPDSKGINSITYMFLPENQTESYLIDIDEEDSLYACG